MKKIVQTSQFKRDIKRLRKRRKDLQKLTEVVTKLVEDRTLEKKYSDHPLTGEWSGSRDCHIEPDWLLIYRTDQSVLYLERSGSHSDLFK